MALTVERTKLPVFAVNGEDAHILRGVGRIYDTEMQKGFGCDSCRVVTVIGSVR